VYTDFVDQFLNVYVLFVCLLTQIAISIKNVAQASGKIDRSREEQIE
jgi:hypothetical protein